MREERQEIRTPDQNILMFVLVDKEGIPYLEVKRQQKTDCVPLDAVLQILRDYKTS